MKSFKLAFVVFAVLGLVSQLPAEAALITVVNSKNSADETRNVSGFSGVSSAGSYNVYITMGNTENLRMEGDSEQISLIETVVEEGTLRIRTQKNSRNWNSGFRNRVNIYITAKSLKSITLSGSGNIEVKNVVSGNELTTSLSGSGDISVTTDVKNYVASISGSGGINTKGSAENAKISVNGSGGFSGSNLKTSVASARVAGSGGITIHADKALDATTAGSGHIRYSGNANVVAHKAGSGSISRRN